MKDSIRALAATGALICLAIAVLMSLLLMVLEVFGG